MRYYNVLDVVKNITNENKSDTNKYYTIPSLYVAWNECNVPLKRLQLLMLKVRCTHLCTLLRKTFHMKKRDHFPRQTESLVKQMWVSGISPGTARRMKNSFIPTCYTPANQYWCTVLMKYSSICFSICNSCRDKFSTCCYNMNREVVQNEL